MPNGLRDLAAYAIGYTAQAYSYLVLLTDRYPNPTRADRAGVGAARRTRCGSSAPTIGRRSRLTVFFRLLLALPHLVWLALWTVAVFFAAFANWVVVLVRGRSAQPLHRFLAAYVRYATHLGAFLLLAANPFPGFTGAPGYPVDAVIDGPERQSRWKTLFRIVLALPAFLVSGALGGAALVAAFLGWFAALATGRMPEGLRKLVSLSLRYTAQVDAYVFVLTTGIPYAGPALDAAAGRGAGRAAGARAGARPLGAARAGGSGLSNRRGRAILLAALAVVWPVAAWLRGARASPAASPGRRSTRTPSSPTRCSIGRRRMSSSSASSSSSRSSSCSPCWRCTPGAASASPASRPPGGSGPGCCSA